MSDSLNLNITLFNEASNYGDLYKSHLLEQYKMYVEMADRVSQRRMIANSLFVTINTFILTSFAWLIKENILSISIIGLLPFLSVFLLCYFWWCTIKSYRQLNSGKFKVIHYIESVLPVRPFDTEWEILGKGKDPKKYRSVSYIENILPLCFTFLYLGLLISLFTKSEFYKNCSFFFL